MRFQAKSLNARICTINESFDGTSSPGKLQTSTSYSLGIELVPGNLDMKPCRNGKKGVERR